jgi:hypothetical protein
LELTLTVFRRCTKFDWGNLPVLVYKEPADLNELRCDPAIDSFIKV